LGHRSRTGDPLYGYPQALQIGAEHLSENEAARLDAKLTAGAVLPETPQHLPRKARTRQGTRHRGHRVVPDLPRPGGRPPRPDPQTMEDSDLGQLRHQRRLQRAHAGDQRRHRKHTPHRQRLQNLNLPTQMPTSRRWPSAATGANKPTMPKCEGPDIQV
jgi:hypothetical protein